MVRRGRAAAGLFLSLLCAALPADHTFGGDEMWSRVWTDPLHPSTAISISVLSFGGDAGLQLASISAAVTEGTRTRLSVGVGFDEALFAFHNLLDDSKVPPMITERLFLLNTACDKRFELTFRITW